MTRLAIALHPAEADALRTLSMHERRTQQNQAALIIRQELTRRGLLPFDASAAKLKDANDAREKGKDCACLAAANRDD